MWYQVLTYAESVTVNKMKNTPAQILLLIAVVLTFGIVFGIWLSRIYSDLLTLGRPQKNAGQTIKPKPSYDTDVIVISDMFFAEQPWAWQILSELESRRHYIVIVQSMPEVDDRLRMYDRIEHSSKDLSKEGVASSSQGLYSFGSEFAYKLAQTLKRSVHFVPLELSYANFTSDGVICLVSDTFSDRMAARKIMTGVMGCEKDYILSELPRVNIREYMQFLAPSQLLIKDAFSSTTLTQQNKKELSEAAAFLARRVQLRSISQKAGDSVMDFTRIGDMVLFPQGLEDSKTSFQGWDVVEVPQSLNRYMIVL
jgi:hypothetical protein